METVITWRYRKIGPPFLRVGRYVRYDLDEVRDWLVSRRNLPRQERKIIDRTVSEAQAAHDGRPADDPR